jgi:hypothetical protein
MPSGRFQLNRRYVSSPSIDSQIGNASSVFPLAKICSLVNTDGAMGANAGRSLGRVVVHWGASHTSRVMPEQPLYR